MGAPSIGQVVDGYRYNGGDPNTKASWSYVDPAETATAPVGDPRAPGAVYLTPGAAPALPQEDRKAIDRFRTQADTAQSRRVDAQRFAKMNERKWTGGVQTLPFLRNLLGMADPEVGEMMSITEKLTPQMREAGSGAMSDRDVAMYRASTLNVGNNGRTNAALARVIDAGAQREAAYAEFMEDWAQRRKGLLGAQEAWNAYANANPLFDNSQGTTQVRPTKPWREWFGVQRGGQAQPPRGAAPARPAGGGRPAKPIKQMSNAELLALVGGG